MRRPLRILLGGKWLGLHLVVLALSVAMVLLGRWQLHVSDTKHFAWQNFIYAVQWWTFTGFLVFFWIRVMRDAVRPPPPTEATGEIVVATRGDLAPRVGPAFMVGDEEAPDGTPTLYRGYVMPQMSDHPDRTGDTTLRDPYNDHLWQLALADAAAGEGPRPTAARPVVDVPTLAARTRAAQARALAAAEPDALSSSAPTSPDDDGGDHRSDHRDDH